MNLEFSKMHGLGNDFMVIDAINQSVDLTSAQVQSLADRHRGVGFDQLLLVEAPTTAAADFRYRIYNADGGEVGQCGNGARCLMRFVHDRGLTDKPELQVETQSGLLQLVLEADGQVTVDMGEPRLAPADVPFDAEEFAQTYPLEVDSEVLEISTLSLGNPHAITVVDVIESAPVARLGPLIESHPRFPQRVNAGFMQLIDPEHIRLRVYERGAGETQACGSGACAAVVAGRLRDQLAPRVNVSLKGGDLVVKWAGEGYPVYMTGPATLVYRGQIDL
ncbi:MAG: diaminopimelate epimerase [Gammaproteobacteria bacterium]|nr:MAG: diaminopimelate epimerase [Gammaproteobacteria bacterium]